MLQYDFIKPFLPFTVGTSRIHELCVVAQVQSLKGDTRYYSRYKCTLYMSEIVVHRFWCFLSCMAWDHPFQLSHFCWPSRRSQVSLWSSPGSLWLLKGGMNRWGSTKKMRRYTYCIVRFCFVCMHSPKLKLEEFWHIEQRCLIRQTCYLNRTLSNSNKWDKHLVYVYALTRFFFKGPRLSWSCLRF